MKPTIADLLDILDGLAPKSLAEKWDNVGLLVGSPANNAGTILIGLDPTNALVDEAIALGAATIITHHPVIFKPLTAIDTGNPAGRLLKKALAGNINIIACHTNFDSTLDGVNDVLADSLGLTDLRPLLPAAAEELNGTGLGRIGSFAQPISADDFLARIFHVLGLPSLNIAGPLPQKIGKVAVCGGSGSDLAETAYRCGADVYLSAEIKHSTAIWANETGFTVIDGTHYATEKPATIYLAKKLKEITGAKNWQIDIRLTETEVAPFVLVNTLTSDKTKP